MADLGGLGDQRSLAAYGSAEADVGPDCADAVGPSFRVLAELRQRCGWLAGDPAALGGVPLAAGEVDQFNVVEGREGGDQASVNSEYGRKGLAVRGRVAVFTAEEPESECHFQ